LGQEIQIVSPLALALLLAIGTLFPAESAFFLRAGKANRIASVDARLEQGACLSRLSSRAGFHTAQQKKTRSFYPATPALGSGTALVAAGSGLVAVSERDSSRVAGAETGRSPPAFSGF
jgi:hypothetical protein